MIYESSDLVTYGTNAHLKIWIVLDFQGLVV